MRVVSLVAAVSTGVLLLFNKELLLLKEATDIIPLDHTWRCGPFAAFALLPDFFEEEDFFDEDDLALATERPESEMAATLTVGFADCAR